MQTVAYRRWCPSRSPLRIDFPTDLVAALTLDTNRHASGVFYGIQYGEDLRLLAARVAPDPNDPSLRQLKLAGMYFYRPRGEVFLTEIELERFLKMDVDVALVISGQRAGFFVRDADGTMESLRSFEEFALKETAAPVVRAVKAFKPPPQPRPRLDWAWAAMAAVVLMAIPIGGMAYLQPLLPAPLNLEVREQEGQLVLSWNPRVDLKGGRIEIIDGRERAIAILGSGQSSATYVVRNRDIAITLRSDPDSGPDRSQTIRYAATPRAVPVLAALAESGGAEVSGLEQQVDTLRAALETSRRRAGALQQRIQSMLKIPAATPEP